jgi:hypothetical protein
MGTSRPQYNAENDLAVRNDPDSGRRSGCEPLRPSVNAETDF